MIQFRAAVFKTASHKFDHKYSILKHFSLEFKKNIL